MRKSPRNSQSNFYAILEKELSHEVCFAELTEMTQSQHEPKAPPSETINTPTAPCSTPTPEKAETSTSTSTEGLSDLSSSSPLTKGSMFSPAQQPTPSRREQKRPSSLFVALDEAHRNAGNEGHAPIGKEGKRF